MTHPKCLAAQVYNNVITSCYCVSDGHCSYVYICSNVWIPTDNTIQTPSLQTRGLYFSSRYLNGT